MKSLKTNKIPELTEAESIRFWSKATLTANPDKCWIWNGTVRDNIKPYGRFSIQNKDYSSHRVAYLLYNKKDPGEMHVLHSCDNHRCINPAHLFLGTNNDNVQDKVSKGRQARNKSAMKGKENPKIKLWNNPASKLTESQWHEVYSLYISGERVIDIASKFNLSRHGVTNLVRIMGGNTKMRTKLTEEQVKNIREAYDKNKGNGKCLAKEYGVTNKAIYDIVNRKVWKHL